MRTVFPVLCDLDGVVWLAHRPIPGSAKAVERLRSAGHRVLFVTNNSSATLADQEAALARCGISAAGDVVTSAQAAATLVRRGERVLACAGPGVHEALRSAGAEVVAPWEGDGAVSSATSVTAPASDFAAEIDAWWRRSGPIDAVVVGWHRRFDYAVLALATHAVLRGARLLASNDDPTYPTPFGPIPGGGAILAAVERATGTRAVVAGKPHRAMAELVRVVVGNDAATSAVMVGDRPSTDGAFARMLGCRFAQVWSGVTSATQPLDGDGSAGTVVFDLVGEDLAGIVDQIVTGG